MSLRLFALATGSEIILTNESYTVNVQVGLETVVKVLENSKAPHGLHLWSFSPKIRRWGPPRVPQLTQFWPCLDKWVGEGLLLGLSVHQFSSTGTRWYRGVTLANRKPVSGAQHWQELLDGVQKYVGWRWTGGVADVFLGLCLFRKQEPTLNARCSTVFLDISWQSGLLVCFHLQFILHPCRSILFSLLSSFLVSLPIPAPSLSL